MKLSCLKCGLEREVKPTAKGNPRPPRGWKNLGGEYRCAACWGAAYVIRAVTISVSGPADPADWPEFREACKTVWRHATRLANWANGALAKNDVQRTAEAAKLAPMPAIYLYGAAKAGFEGWPDETLDKASAGDILTAAEQKYRAQRYETLWLCSRTLSNYRYPQPYPLRPEAWEIEHDEADGRYYVSARIAGRRWRLRLAGGNQWRRQLAGIQHLLEHPDLAAQGAIYEVRSHAGDHRNGIAGKRDGGGVPFESRIMFKFVGWFPVASADADGTLSVRTDADSLLVALDEKNERIWTYNGDQAKRILLKHQDHMRRLQRLADDRKAEKRKPRREGRAYRDMLADVSRKDRQRLTSLCHEVSASLVEFARRRKLAAIRYDDSGKEFSDYFPYAKLRLMVEQKARVAGIVFEGSGCEKKPATARKKKEVRQVQ